MQSWIVGNIASILEKRRPLFTGVFLTVGETAFRSLPASHADLCGSDHQSIFFRL